MGGVDPQVTLPTTILFLPFSIHYTPAIHQSVVKIFYFFPIIGKLTMNLLKIAIILFTLSLTPALQAAPPFIDYQWTFSAYCLDMAKPALQSAGFKITNSGSSEVVGVQGEYKGVLACPNETEIALFIVSGPDYQKAKILAVRMKQYFSN